MKTHHKFLLSFSVSLFIAAASARAADEISIFAIDRAALKVEYYVPMKRFLAETNGWSPAMPFPIDLGEYSKRAIQRLRETRQIKGEISLVTARLSSMTHWLADDRVQGPLPGRIIERWVLVFSFQTDQPDPDVDPTTLRVAMLFDGTIAEERLVKGTLGRAVPNRR